MLKYLKFAAALAGTVATVLVSSLSDGHVSAAEWVQVAISAATAAGVWTAANVPSLTWAKAAIAAVLAGLNLLVTYLVGGVTVVEWINIGLAVAGALGVYAIPNRGSSVAGKPAAAG